MESSYRFDLVITIISFSIALSISFRRNKEKQQTLASLFTFLVAVVFLLKYAFITSSTHIWLRLCLGVLIPLPLLLLFVISTFMKEEDSLSIELFTIQYIFAPILIVGLSTPIFNSREFVLFVISYVYSMLTFTFSNLIYLALRSSEPSLRRRLLLFATIGLMGVVLSILSLKLKDSNLAYGLSSISVILLLVYISESVLNTRLLDFQEFSFRILVLILISVIISVIYWLFVILMADRPFDMMLNSFAVSIAIALLFERFREFIIKFISIYVTARTRDFIARIKRLQKEISSIIDADTLIKRVTDEIFASRKVSGCAFYALSEDRTYYRLYYSLGEQKRERIDNITDRILIDTINEQRQVLIREILEKQYTQESTPPSEEVERNRTQEIIASMERINATLLFPIIVENEVLYILAINDSGLADTLNAEEIGAIMELCEQISISLQNLKVFESIKERDRLAALGEMAAGLAHEIRNPLGAIKGAAQYLNPANLPSEEAEFLKIIIEETDRLNRVLTQFLDYSRPYQCELSVVNLDEVLRQIIRLYSVPQDEKYKFNYSNEGGEIYVKLDVEQFRQVILNIIKNAQEAMPDGGSIDIKVYRYDGKKRTFSSVFSRDRDSSDRVIIEIRDYGTGIEESNLNKVFIPFFTTKKSGTGLGLAISKKIIESHNGKLEINSKKGEGTMVRVILPVLSDTEVKR